MAGFTILANWGDHTYSKSQHPQYNFWQVTHTIVITPASGETIEEVKINIVFSDNSNQDVGLTRISGGGVGQPQIWKCEDYGNFYFEPILATPLARIVLIYDKLGAQITY